MKITRLGPAGRERWLTTARACPYATYFHTPAWAELITLALPELAVATEAFRLSDGTVAVVPLVSYRRGHFFRGYHSMAPGVYGGPIAERALTQAEVTAVIDRVGGLRQSIAFIHGNPYLEAFAATPETGDDFTHRFELREGFDALFRRFHRNHRRTYTAALKSGLVLDRARTLEDWRDYYAVYRMSHRRWGDRAKIDYPFEMFAEIHRRQDPNVILWLARLDGRVIAGDLWFYWNRHNVGWHGAADPSFFRVHATNFLITEILRDACARGDRWCDLNPSGGDAGVVAFKDSFGLERRYFRHARRSGGSLYRRHQRARRLFDRLTRRLRAGIARR